VLNPPWLRRNMPKVWARVQPSPFELKWGYKVQIRVGVPFTLAPVLPSTSSLTVVSSSWGVIVVVDCHIIALMPAVTLVTQSLVDRLVVSCHIENGNSDAMKKPSSH